MGAFVHRMKPGGRDMIPEALAAGVITTGWSDTPDLMNLPDWKDFRDRIRTAYYLAEDPKGANRARSNASSAFSFIHRMAIDDYVVIPRGDDVFICRVTGPITFEAAGQETDTAHRRRVEWLTPPHRPARRRDASKRLQECMSNGLTCCRARNLDPDILALLGTVVP